MSVFFAWRAVRAPGRKDADAIELPARRGCRGSFQKLASVFRISQTMSESFG
jgi:hypothetical protein